MNAVDLLVHDHRVIEKIFSEFKTATANRWQELFNQVYSELTVHMKMEELEFYPALAAIVPDQVDHSLHEHFAMNSLLEELRILDKGQPIFENRFGDLMMEVQKHIQEEERSGGIFEVSRRHINDLTLADIGERMARIKEISRGPKAGEVAKR
jgi:hemerythrin superfamily protein